MKLSKKLIAVPAIALAASVSLAACGSSSGSSGGSGKSASSSPQATACADWAQAKAESTTAEAQVDILKASAALGPSMSAAGSNASLWHLLQMVYDGDQMGSEATVQAYAPEINKICTPTHTVTAAPAPTTPAPTTAAPASAAAPAPAAPAPAAPAAPVTDVPAGMTNCGGGVYAGADTSCPFAQNVAADYTGNGPFSAYSPITGQSYTMTCTGPGTDEDVVTCEGGNNAEVAFIN